MRRALILASLILVTTACGSWQEQDLGTLQDAFAAQQPYIVRVTTADSERDLKAVTVAEGSITGLEDGFSRTIPLSELVKAEFGTVDPGRTAGAVVGALFGVYLLYALTALNNLGR